MPEKINLEYTIKSDPKVLFNRISTPWGLSEWFADDVELIDDLYVFSWNDAKQEAKVVKSKKDQSIRFHWIDDEEDDTYFEFKISVDELTNDVALEITDFAESEDIEDVTGLWDTQIDKLKLLIGS
jgi:uncharacterized protein YndB with AHSA1/START domain